MRPLLLGGALALTLAACGSGVDARPIVATNQASIGVGEQRILLAVTAQDTNEYLATADDEIKATLRDRIGSPLGEYDGEFVWMVPDVRGLYAFAMEIPGPGTFQITLESSEFGDMGPIGLAAVENPPMVNVGEAAPLSETRTIDDHAIEEITSDPDPDTSFYEMTVAEAVQSGPSVIVFGTPRWCTTQTCGPLLDQVKALSGQFPTLNYVHVEVYENIDAQSFDDLVLVPSVEEWSLPSEPWVFVVDDGGIVSAAFEGVASDSELSAAFESVSR